jgi:hypothetical protein
MEHNPILAIQVPFLTFILKMTSENRSPNSNDQYFLARHVVNKDNYFQRDELSSYIF